MISTDDYIVRHVGQHGRKDKFYKTWCNNCGSDRGYLLKTQDKRLNCNKCAKLGSRVSTETRAKMSKAAYNRHPRIKKSIDGRSIRCITTYARDYGVSKKHRELRHNIKTLINQKLKRRSVRKELSIYNMLNYSIDDLRRHLESQFANGMSWENYGEWHIDHIVPDSWFSYSSHNDAGFKESWSLQNLQPLWAKDNMRKSNKFTGGLDAITRK